MDTSNFGESSRSSPHTTPEVTPSNTTATLPTPDPVHAQLSAAQNFTTRSHFPPRFIFYPISWDGSEDPSKRPCSVLQKDYIDDDWSPTVFCATDAFHSIDRWRRDVVKCGDGIAGLLDPIQDLDAPFPLLSLPRDHHSSLVQGKQPSRPPFFRSADSVDSEDEVQLWIHP